MEFSLGKLLFSLGIEAKVDEALENERRYYKKDYHIKDAQDIKAINALYSREALIPDKDPANYTTLQGDPCVLTKVPILEGYSILLTWDVFNDEPRTGIAGWIYKPSFIESSKCCNSPMPDSQIRFRIWKRIQVESSNLEFASFVLSKATECYTRYHSYNLSLIQAAIMGLPYKLQLVYENVIISDNSTNGKDIMSSDPPYWTCPMYQGYRSSTNKGVTPDTASGNTNGSSSSSSSNSRNNRKNSNNSNNAVNSIRSNVDDAKELHSYQNISKCWLDVKNFKDLNSILQDGYNKYNDNYVKCCYPYCEIVDGTNYGIPDNWTTLRGFNFFCNELTDLNGWQYSDSFWLTNTDGSEIKDVLGNRVAQQVWFPSRDVELNKYMNELTSAVAGFYSAKRTETAASDGEAGHRISITPRSRKSTLTESVLKSDGKSPTRKKKPREVFKEKIQALRSRDKDIYSKEQLCSMKVKRRLWCRILCPKAQFNKINSVLNTFLKYHPRGLIYSGELLKRGVVVHSWRERTMKLSDDKLEYFKGDNRKGTIYHPNGSVRKITKKDLEELDGKKADAIYAIQKMFRRNFNLDYAFIIESAQLEKDELFEKCGIVKKLSTIEEDDEFEEGNDPVRNEPRDDNSDDSDSNNTDKKNAGKDASKNLDGLRSSRMVRTMSESPPLGMRGRPSANAQMLNSSTTGVGAAPSDASKKPTDDVNSNGSGADNSKDLNANKSNKSSPPIKNENDNENDAQDDESENGYRSDALNEDNIRALSGMSGMGKLPGYMGPKSYHSFHSKNSNATTQTKTSLLSIWSMEAAGIDCPDLIMMARSEKQRIMWCELIQSQISFRSIYKVFDVDGSPSFFPTIPTEFILEESESPIKDYKIKQKNSKNPKLTTADMLLIDRFSKDKMESEGDDLFEFEEFVYYTSLKEKKRLEQEAIAAAKAAAAAAVKPAAKMQRMSSYGTSFDPKNDPNGKQGKPKKEKRSTLSSLAFSFLGGVAGVKNEVLNAADKLANSSDDEIGISTITRKQAGARKSLVENDITRLSASPAAENKTENKVKHGTITKDSNVSKVIQVAQVATVAGGPEFKANASIDTDNVEDEPEIVEEQEDYVEAKGGIKVPVFLIKGINIKKKFINESTFTKRLVWIDQNQYGHWCVYWSKSDSKPKYPNVPKGFAARELASCEIGTVSLSGSDRPLVTFISHDEATQTVSMRLKNTVEMSGIDLVLPTLAEARQFYELIQCFILNKA